MAFRTKTRTPSTKIPVERAICKEGVLSLCYGVGHNSYGEKVFTNTGEKVDIRCRCRKVDGRVNHTCKAHEIVQLYRGTRPGVTKLWRVMEKAALNALKNPGRVFKAGKRFKFCKRGMFLYMRLPNGRTLKYPGCDFAMVDKWGRGELEPEIFYFGKETRKKNAAEIAQGDSFDINWRKKKMYGAKFFQNACQAIARDIMCEAMERPRGCRTERQRPEV